MSLTVSQLQGLSFGYLSGSDLTGFCSAQLLIKQEEVYNNIQQACDDAMAEITAALATKYNLTMELQKQGFTPAILLAVVNTLQVVSISIIYPGSGYQSAPIISFMGGGGSGASFTATISNGQITAVTQNAPGANYTSVPSVVLTGGGPTTATGAAGTAILTQGVITGVTVNNGGQGYYNAPEVNFIGGFPGGAPPFCAAVASAAVNNGAVSAISIINGGSGYFSTPQVVIAPRVPVTDNRERLFLKIVKIMAIRNAMGNMLNISDKMKHDFKWAEETLALIRRGQMNLSLPQPNNPRVRTSPVEIVNSSFWTLG